MRAGQVPALAVAALLHAGVLAALLYLNLTPKPIELAPSAMVVTLAPKGPSAAPMVGPPQPEEPAPAEADRKSTRLNSSHIPLSRMPSSA